jgi:hypothetical protein
MEMQKLLDELVERIKTAQGTNLVSLILYGSAAAGDYLSDHSDLNVLCVVQDTPFTAIEALGSTIDWWSKKKHRAPLLLGKEELHRSADVFSIEFLDMRRHYRLLFGEDILKSLEIPMRLHRAQLEYELREKTILLRQGLLTASSGDDKWNLLLRSLPSFGTLFRHTLIALGNNESRSKRESASALGDALKIDASVYGELLDVREKKNNKNMAKLDEFFARYLKLVQQVTAAVDKMLDPTT